MEVEINTLGCPACREEYKTKLKEVLKPYLKDLCPDCQAELENWLQIKNDYQSNQIIHIPKYFPDSITWDDDSIPSCCKNCSNHPSNGGSGICNCTLPLMTTTKWN